MKKIFITLLLLLCAAVCLACSEAPIDITESFPSETEYSVRESSSSVNVTTESGVETDEPTSEVTSHGTEEPTVSDVSDETSESDPVSESSSVMPSSDPISSETSDEQTSSEIPVSSAEPSSSVENSSETSSEPPLPYEVNGLIVYDHRIMEPFGGKADAGAKTALLMNQFKKSISNDINVYAMIIPTSSAFYAPAGYEKCITRTKECFEGLRDALDGVVYVDVLSALAQHTSEPIYSKTDHHWFALGAYYGAEAFCKAAGADFAKLDSFVQKQEEGYLGSLASKVPEIKEYPETFIWYEPQKTYTAEFYTQEYQPHSRFLRNIFSTSKNYSKFIHGDSYAVHIPTDVHNGRKLLVIKDSFGNALAPFLVTGFEDIYIVDLREFECNILTFIEDQEITDVVFTLSSFSVSGSKRDHITRLMNL